MINSSYLFLLSSALNCCKRENTQTSKCTLQYFSGTSFNDNR